MNTKKLGLIHYLAAFLACIILGGWVSFRLLAGLFSNAQTEPVLAENASNLIPSTGQFQHNFLLIEVDHLNNTQPALQSIWAVFSIPSNPAFITFKQLYPSTTEPQLAASLQHTFLLTGEKRPAAEFLQTITERFWLDGTIIVDEVSIQEFNQWLHSQQAIPPNNPDQVSSTATLMQFCEQVNQNNLPKQVAWDSIFSDRFVSDIEINLAIKTWKALSEESGNHHCEVIP